MEVTLHSYEQLEEEVLHLPKADRSLLASRLLQSLEVEETALTPEWREELRRRASDIDSGHAKLIPAEEGWKEINQRFGTNL